MPETQTSGETSETIRCKIYIKKTAALIVPMVTKTLSIRPKRLRRNKNFQFVTRTYRCQLRPPTQRPKRVPRKRQNGKQAGGVQTFPLISIRLMK